MAYYFWNKSTIIDVRLGYISASENIEIFKAKVEQIIATVTTRSVFCLKSGYLNEGYFLKELSLSFKTLYNNSRKNIYLSKVINKKIGKPMKSCFTLFLLFPLLTLNKRILLGNNY